MDLSEIEIGKWYWYTEMERPVFVVKVTAGMVLVAVPTVTEADVIETINGYRMTDASANFYPSLVPAHTLSEIIASPDEPEW